MILPKSCAGAGERDCAEKQDQKQNEQRGHPDFVETLDPALDAADDNNSSMSAAALCCWAMWTANTPRQSREKAAESSSWRSEAVCYSGTKQTQSHFRISYPARRRGITLISHLIPLDIPDEIIHSQESVSILPPDDRDRGHIHLMQRKAHGIGEISGNLLR